MKILVPVERLLDYNVKPRVKSDGSGIDLLLVGDSAEMVVYA